MDYISLGLTSEELEAIDTTLRVVNSVHKGLSGMTRFQWGTEAQQRDFLTPLVEGEWIGCGAFSEPGAGLDFANVQGSAKRGGDDYVLNGEKIRI